MEQIKPHISILIPTYCCEECLAELYRRLCLSLDNISQNFEVIFINDASPQGDWQVIRKLAETDWRVKGLNLSRNFGQHYAITAGLDYCSGDWVVVMDGDLQDQPEEIVKLYNKAQQGFDIVFARRYERKDSFIKRLGSKLFHKVFDYLAETESDSSIANFSICSRDVIESVKAMREHNRSYPHFLRWVGYKYTYVNVEHSARFIGKTSYDFQRKVNLALDTIVAHSNKPLKIFIKFGFVMALVSLLFGIYFIIQHYIMASSVAGWTSVIVSLYFIGGLLFAGLGTLGLYIGKIFDETKNRPLFIVKEKINVD